MLRILAALALLAPSPLSAQSTLTGDLPRKDERPLEAVEGIETQYGDFTTSEGLRLRTLVSRPSGADEPLKAIFLAQWVSCGSVEFRANRNSEMIEMVRHANVALIRVERSGTGDSEGAGCNALDYDTEVRHYREALAELRDHPWVDGGRIVIYGSSLGSTTAPLIARGNDVAGVIVQGGGAYTYLERMIEFDRLNLERSGDYTLGQIHDEMLKRIPFHYHYLVHDRHPRDIERDHPELAGVWESILGTDGDLHYGRPLAWHQQAAKHNFLEAWAALEVPIMVVYAEYDQFERQHGHEVIAQLVNRLRPGTATFVRLDGIGHSLRRYPDAFTAYPREGGEEAFDAFLDPVLAWLGAID